MINCYEGYMDTNLVLPVDVDHCRVIFDFYFEISRGRRRATSRVRRLARAGRRPGIWSAARVEVACLWRGDCQCGARLANTVLTAVADLKSVVDAFASR